MDDFNDRLNISVSEEAILGAVYLSILADIPSWPLALVTSSTARRSHTSCSQHITSSNRRSTVDNTQGVIG